MPPEVLARLGEPFFTTKERGSGLGLGISRRIVDEHGGTLDDRARTPGEGTEVAVTPAAAADRGAHEPPPGRRRRGRSSRSWCARSSATRTRIDVVATASRRRSAALDEVAYDVVLTDLHMPPGPDGIELIRRARERDVDVPFIVLTGHATVETAVDAMREGAFDYLRKTAIGDELRAVGRSARSAHGRMAREVRRLRGEVAEARGAAAIVRSATSRAHARRDGARRAGGAVGRVAC